MFRSARIHSAPLALLVGCLLAPMAGKATALDLESGRFLISEPEGTTWVVVLDEDHITARIAAYRNDRLWVTYGARAVHLGEEGLLIDGTQAPVFGPRSASWSPDSFLLAADDGTGQITFDLRGHRGKVTVNVPPANDRLIISLQGGLPFPRLSQKQPQPQLDAVPGIPAPPPPEVEAGDPPAPPAKPAPAPRADTF